MEEVQFDVEQKPYQSSNSTLVAIIVGIVVFISVFIGVFLVLDGDEPGSAKTKIEITNAKIEVEYSEYLGYTAVIKGVAKNVTNKDFSYVSIEYSVYDASGNNLGTAWDNINNLSSGDTWQFECNLLYYGEKRPVSFKLIEITAW